MGEEKNTSYNKYPFRNKVAFDLYTDSIKNFYKEVEGRTLVPYLSREYSLSLGYELSSLAVMEWKYSFEMLYSLLHRAKANPEAGISVFLVKNVDSYFVSVMLGSMDENEFRNVSMIIMLPWTDFRSSQKEGLVEYRSGSDFYAESIHPSALASAIIDHLDSNCFDSKNLFFRPGVFFFDVCKTAENDITVNLEQKNISDAAPVFYASELNELCTYIRPSVNGFSGSRLLNTLITLKDIADNSNGIPIERNYYNLLAMGYCEKKTPFLMIVSGRFYAVGDSVTKYYKEQNGLFQVPAAFVSCDEELESVTEDTQLIIYFDYVPEKIGFEKVPYNIVIVDPLAIDGQRFGYLTKLKGEAEAYGADYYQNSYNTVSGFVDGGGGNNWLIRHFHLGLIEYQRWYSKLYSIEVVDDLSLFSHREGIANVIVPDSFRFNPEADTVESSEEDKHEFYRRISKGSNGVCLYIADPAMRQRISGKIEESKGRYNWIDRLVNDYGGDIEKIMEAQQSLLSNSAVQTKYRKFIVSSLGQSTWDKLSQSSRSLVISALLSYNDMKEYNSGMDFSGVSMMISKVFECELKQRIAVDFMEYLQKKYGSQYMKYLPSTLMTGPQNKQTPKDPDTINMGDVPFIMGYTPSGKLTFPKRFDIFREYAEKELFPRGADVRNCCSTIVKIEDYIRRNYRNVSAHSENVDVILATRCISDSITDKRMLGVMMDMFKA